MRRRSVLIGVITLALTACSREPENREAGVKAGETKAPASSDATASPAGVSAGAKDAAGGALQRTPELGTENQTADRLRVETWPDIRDATFEERHTFREGAQEIITYFDREIRNLRPQPAGGPEESTPPQAAALRELEAMRLELQQRFSELSSTNEESWERARAAFAETWERARQEYSEAFGSVMEPQKPNVAE